ncbi:MAG: LysR family transcriptional regulator [Bacteroidota bacterium]
MLNLEWYRTFKLVYQLGTFSAAAEELYMSQPGVRKQIGALESYVGQKLFERLPKKVAPTEYAHLLYGQVIGPMEKLEHVESAYRKRASKVKPTIQIGSPYEFFSHIFSRKIHEFDFNVRIELEMAKSLLDSVEKGKLDMAISVINPRGYDVEVIPFFEEELLLVGNSKIDLSLFQEMIDDQRYDEAEDWLNSKIWYVYSGNLTLIRRFWRNNFGRRPSMVPKFIIPNLNIIKRCLMYSDKEAVSLIPNYLCKDELMGDRLKTIWKGDKRTSNELFFVLYKRSPYKNELGEVMTVLKNQSFFLDYGD